MATTPKGAPYPAGTDKLVDGDDAIHALATWIVEGSLLKWGRIDRTVEANGFVRLSNAESFFDGVKASAIIAMGLNDTMSPKWDGTWDNGGCLLKVFGKGGNQSAPYTGGDNVAIYYLCIR